MPEEERAETLDRLLDRSEEFEAALIECFPVSGFVLADASDKHQLCSTACTLSAEHASVLRLAFTLVAPNSGAALLRLQYEGLLRAAWLLHAASPVDVAKLARSLDLDAEQAAKNMPGYSAMLEAVLKHAPVGLAAPLEEFNRYSRHALNSFVHTGIHPLRRAQEGFPILLAHRLIAMSNGLLHFAYRILAVLSGSKRRLDKVTNLYLPFADCLPVVETTASGGPGAA